MPIEKCQLGMIISDEWLTKGRLDARPYTPTIIAWNNITKADGLNGDQGEV